MEGDEKTLIGCQVTFGCLVWGFLLIAVFPLWQKKKKKNKNPGWVEGLLTKEMAFPPFLLKVLWGKTKT